MNKWRSELIALGLFLLIALIVGLTHDSCVSDQQKQRAVELKKLATEIAPYPAAKANGDKVIFKDVVYFATYYSTPDGFNQVKDFYDQELKAKGWARVPSPTSNYDPPDWRRYRKGDYAVMVAQGDKDQSVHFDVTFEWNPGQE
jgi:hypothetical protein